MSYKTILVHVDQSRHLGARVAAAARLAVVEQAHLVGVAMTGISRFAYTSGAPTLAAHLEALRARAAGALAEFESLARGLGVASIETRLIEDDAAGGISVQARYSDLVVVGQTDPHDPSPSVLPDFPEYVLMHCGRPVLIVPRADAAPFQADNILLAWDASLEATRAIGGALPLLRRAGRVDLVVFNPDPHAEEAHGAQPGADIALYLARHGIRVNVAQRRTEAAIGAALLAEAAALSSDLIVMGGYGHSRLREIVLGGTTRSVLDAAAVPVLMAH